MFCSHFYRVVHLHEQALEIIITNKKIITRLTFAPFDVVPNTARLLEINTPIYLHILGLTTTARRDMPHPI